MLRRRRHAVIGRDRPEGTGISGVVIALVGLVGALLGAFVTVVGSTAVDRRAATRSACVSFLSSSPQLTSSMAHMLDRLAKADTRDPEARQQIAELSKEVETNMYAWQRSINEIYLIAHGELAVPRHSL